MASGPAGVTAKDIILASSAKSASAAAPDTSPNMAAKPSAASPWTAA